MSTTVSLQQYFYQGITKQNVFHYHTDCKACVKHHLDDMGETMSDTQTLQDGISLSFPLFVMARVKCRISTPLTNVGGCVRWIRCVAYMAKTLPRRPNTYDFEGARPRPDPTTPHKHEIHHYPTTHLTILVSDVRTQLITSPAGAKGRRVAATDTNEHSSRLHSGSELLAPLGLGASVSIRAGEKGGRLKETQSINESLIARGCGRGVGKVDVSAANSLNGNWKTLMVLHLSPLACGAPKRLVGLAAICDQGAFSLSQRSSADVRDGQVSNTVMELE
ncbi:hypothetical protein B0H13DRAFT_2307120 [Mycena leptocephala]|nr:hypothetical protein B0H13DRAFT_2307120 [Mycena leptocephala]